MVTRTHVQSQDEDGDELHGCGTPISGHSMSTSRSMGSPSSRSEQTATTPASDHAFVRLNHLDIHGDAAASKKRKRVQHPAGGNKGGRGLRQFSMKVCEKVESKGITTYSEVADELVIEFAEPGSSVSSPDQQNYDEKNIRRRVYDALNVLMAMGIIFKDKKEIQWKGFPHTSVNDIGELKTECLGLRNRIEKKAAYLQELEEQYVGLQSLIQQNEQLYSSGNAPSGGVALPFILVQTRPHATVEVEISEDMQLVHFDFNSTPFKLHDDNSVLKAMKFRERSQRGNYLAHKSTADGVRGSAVSSMLQPQASHPSMPNPQAEPPASPSLPGILKARVKHEHNQPL